MVFHFANICNVSINNESFGAIIRRKHKEKEYNT